ncbi:LuxS/MPP-like metallohydrolase [Trametes maxima]|nr:LuxS/MPP-like metallohydrolase [Trametes maxima]
MSTWADVPAADDVPGYRVFVGELEKPSLDIRQYRLVELHNGLRAVLVQDAGTDKAAACLALTTGHMLDPEDAPGLAHFCEHMISKGSEPYPAENDFLSFINANGGSRNASTGPASTEYWFSIRSAELGAGLPRLAAFFHAPLFTESLTAREINAVDAEFKKNLQNDARRILQVTKHLSIPGHPWAKFGTGNYASLSAVGRSGEEAPSEEAVLKETRRRLVDWWRQEYCASRMMLAVIGRESVDELASLVVPHFSRIPNRGLDPRPAFKTDAWGPEHTGTLTFVQTVKDYYAFDVSFQLPDMRTHYQSKPGSFLSHLLGHEGPGSVCTYLKKKGWLLSLSAGSWGSSRGAQFFKVHGRLTVEGYAHYRDVVETVFDYLALLRDSPLPAYHYDEVRTMAATNFHFKEKSHPHSYASTLAIALAEPYPPEWLLSGAHLYREWDEATVRQLLDGFVPARARITLEAKNHLEQVVGPDVRWETEKWYGTQYTVRRMDDAFLHQINGGHVNEELHLPAPNPFIPQNLSVDRVDVPEPKKYPLLVKRTELSQLWHKKDDQFWVPKALIFIDIKSPLAYTTPRHAVLTRIFVDLVEDALAELTYDAGLAGVSYSVMNQIEGLSVFVGGYNDKLPVLLRIVLEKIRDLRVQPDRMQVLKEKIQRECENFYMRQPSQLSEQFAIWLLMPTVWTPAEKLSELTSITESEIERHRDALLSKTFIEALVNGTMSQERSLDIMTLVEECLAPRPLLPKEIPRQRSLVLPPGSDVVFKKRHSNPEEVNSSLSYYLQFGDISDTRLCCTLALIADMLREPCYSILRTEEQLGYVVACSQWSINGINGLGIRIQSARAPSFLESRVDAFLETLGAGIASLPLDEFATYKEGLIVKKLERVKNLREETARFWSHIESGYYDFIRHETDASVIRELTRDEVVRTYDALVRPSSGAQTRKKLSVHLLSQQLDEHPLATSAVSDANPAATDATTTATPTDSGAVRPRLAIVLNVDDNIRGEGESVFKAGLACGPAATPVFAPAFGEYGHALARSSGACTRAIGSAPLQTGCAASTASRL